MDAKGPLPDGGPLTAKSNLGRMSELKGRMAEALRGRLAEANERRLALREDMASLRRDTIYTEDISLSELFLQSLKDRVQRGVQEKRNAFISAKSKLVRENCNQSIEMAQDVIEEVLDQFEEVLAVKAAMDSTPVHALKAVMYKDMGPVAQETL